MQLLPTSEVAKRLGKTQRTIIRMCQSGKLKSQWGVSNGKPGYLVEWSGNTEEHHPTGTSSHSNYFEDWRQSARLTLAPSSVDSYARILTKYFEKHQNITTKFVQVELMAASSWATRQTLHGALGNYAKYLESIGLMVEPIPRCSLKPEKPIRRTVLTLEELEGVFKAIKDSKFYTGHEKALNAALVAFMAYTGARVSEAATFTVERINLNQREVTLLRKGGIWQDMGLPLKLVPYLEEYLPYRTPAPGVTTFFLNLAGKPLCRRSVGARMRRISATVGVDFTAHGLRRTFATINSQMGRPIEVISKALNHSKLATTQKYLRTTQKQVVSHTKEWDF